MTQHVDVDIPLKRRLNELLFVEPADLQGHAEELIAMGEVLLFLVSDWSAWMERRVETVHFLDADTVRRHISVDFILPNVPTPIRRDRESVTFVPLGLLLKRELVAFDLQDEAGHPLPLLARRHNGPLAAAILAAGARMWVGDPSDLPEPLPLSILQDLWTIANSDPDPAIECWRRIRIPKTEAENEALWRRHLLASKQFMALARDLARNFLVMTPLVVEQRRRILKFTYQDVGEAARFQPPPPPRRPRPSLRRVRLRRGRSPTEQGVGRVRVSAVLQPDPVGPESGDYPRGEPEPLPGVEVTLTRESVSHTAITQDDGIQIVQLDVGEYSVSYDPPEGTFSHETLERCAIPSPGQEVPVALVFSRGPRFAEPPQAPRLTVVEKLRRAFALAPKPIEISIPSAGQCHSYHMQFETADGLHITAATLRHVPSVTIVSSASTVSEIRTPFSPLQQRVGLAASGLPADTAAAATFTLRPRSQMVVRSAFYTAILGCVVLGATLVAHAPVSVSPEAWVALLLVVPGGISAYVGRERENRFATEVLIGLRSLARMTAIWAFAAAILVVVSREPETRGGDIYLHAPSEWTFWCLVALLVGNIVTALILLIAWRRANRPPEFKASQP
jgi:hypothetical protein